MTSDEVRVGIVEAGRAAILDIRQASAEAVAAVIRVVEAETGETLAVQRPSIMDATQEQLAHAERRARHALAAVDLIRRWHWGDAQTLGELMPTLPEDVREQIADNLVRAGLS